MTLTDEQRAAYTVELAAMEKARTDLLTGGRKTSVQYDNRKVEFAPADINAIVQRITELKALLGLVSRRAIAVGFGRR